MSDPRPDVVIRPATRDDVPAVVALLADDPIGATRETPGDLAPYLAAFDVLVTDPHQLVAVAERHGVVVATLQLTLIPGLSRRGATRAQIEAVRVAASERGGGVGSELVRWAIRRAGEWGCSLVQLTSDKTRADAHRFYHRLGFAATHEGFKLAL